MMRKQFLRLSAILGFSAVVLGAFGAHTLETYLSAEKIASFETGVRYHFYHTIMIAVISVMGHFGRKKYLSYAGWAFALGIVLFSGSIYLLSLNEIISLPSWLGIITPIGGTAFIAGWIFLFLATFQNYDRSQKAS